MGIYFDGDTVGTVVGGNGAILRTNKAGGISSVYDGYGLSNIPMGFILVQNHPNPFNPATKIKYQLPSFSKLSLKVYNLLGQVVATLFDGLQSAGYQSATWNASSFSSGVYFYKLEAVSVADHSRIFTSVKKMLLVK